MLNFNPAMYPAATKLRAMLADQDKIIVCPGVYDGFTARIALNDGFDCLYMTGAGTTMSKLGMPDLGVATLNDMRENASPLMVGRTTAQYIQAGVAGFHLEDQVVTKRCGHLRNKELVEEDVFLSRIRAAANMRSQVLGDVVIIARTDSLQSLGFEVAISRLKSAIAVGADVAFLEGFTTKDEARRACKELAPTPVLLNMVEGGVTPHISVAEAREIGFKIIIYPAFALAPVFQSVSNAAKELKETGDLKSQTKELSGAGVREIFGVCGLKEALEFDVAAGGKLYSKGV